MLEETRMVFCQIDEYILSGIVFREKRFSVLLQHVPGKSEHVVLPFCTGEELPFSGPMCHSRHACRLRTAIRRWRSPTFKKPPGYHATRRSATVQNRTQAGHHITAQSAGRSRPHRIAAPARPFAPHGTATTRARRAGPLACSGSRPLAAPGLTS